MRSTLKTLISLLVVVLAAATLASCGSDSDTDTGAAPTATDHNGDIDDTGDAEGGTLTVYVGRDEELIGPRIAAFTEATGIRVEARYGDSTDMALLISTEGDRSPADVYLSQSPGAVALLANGDELATIDDEVLDLVQPSFRADDGTWVGLSGRQRVIVYNTDMIDEADLPQSVAEVTDPAYAGMVGVAPTNGSFQDFVTAVRAELGDDGALEWLEGLAANDPQTYEKNGAIVEAVGRGEVAMGLVNHYYNEAARAEDPDLLSRNHFLPADDIGSLVLVASGSIMASSENQAAANRFLAFMLNEETQQYFVSETFEYALIDGIDPPGGLPPLAGLSVQVIDDSALGDELERTIELIDQSGLSG